MRDEYSFPGELSRGVQGRKVKLAQKWLTLSEISLNPDVFNPMIDRLAEFVVPYQQAMETETA